MIQKTYLKLLSDLWWTLKKMLQISVQALVALMIPVTTLNTKKDEIPCLVFTFGSDQPSRILQKTYQSDNVPIFQHASRKQWEKTVIVILLLSWGIEARKKKKKATYSLPTNIFFAKAKKV